MNPKPAIALWLTLVLATTFSAAVLAESAVGVKRGDWIEYNVAFTGNPPAEHDVEWARMEVVNVETNRVNATFISRLANGTMLNVSEDVDFDTGSLIDMFIIPAGLNAGDTFYDQTVGNVTIDRLEVRTYADAARSVVHAETVDTQWYWDQATGVAVEARTSNPVYTLDTVARNTGLWSPQILGLEWNVFYALLVLAVIATSAVPVALFFRRKRKHGQNPSSKDFRA